MAVSDLVIASDGLPARKQRGYAKAKLEFLDHFIPPALSATGTKRDRVYLDLFAGPGLNVDVDAGEEFEGSPLRMLRLHGADRAQTRFTRAILCNIEPDEDAALRERVTRTQVTTAAGGPRIEFVPGDCNERLDSILASIHPKAYLLVFADLEGISQFPWTTVTALKQHHESVDLYVLFPTELSLNRLLGTNPSHRARHERVLTAFFGCEDWRAIVADWTTDAQGAVVRQQLEQLYRRQLGTLWPHVDLVEVARIGADRLLYRMLFATAHPAARRIAEWTKRLPREGQFGLGLG